MTSAIYVCSDYVLPGLCLANVVVASANKLLQVLFVTVRWRRQVLLESQRGNRDIMSIHACQKPGLLVMLNNVVEVLLCTNVKIGHSSILQVDYQPI